MNKMIKIATLNARGGNSKKEHIIRFFNENKLAILLIQETHDLRAEFTKEIEQKTDTKIFQSNGSNLGRGVITMIKNCEAIKDVYLEASDNDGNEVEVSLQINGEHKSIINIYCPNNIRKRRQLLERISDRMAADADLIVGGDYNQILDLKLDSSGKSEKEFEKTKCVRNILDEMKEKHQYADTYRSMKTNGKDYTFTGLGNYRARLDCFYVHRTMLPNVSKCGVTPCSFSDHDMYWIDVTEERRIRWGNGTWVYNDDLLKQRKNMDTIRQIWKEHQDNRHEFNNQLVWWDSGKDMVKEKLQEIGRKMARERDSREKEITRELESLQNKPEKRKRIEELKRELNLIIEARMKGAAIRSQEEWSQKGEQSTRYFFSLEKRKGDEKCMTELKNEDGKTMTDKTEVLEYCQRYYEDHFRKQETRKADQDLLIDSVENILTPEQHDSMQHLFTTEELEKVLKNMKLNRAPGADGFTVNFYRQTWSFIGNDLLDTINEQALSGKMTRTMTQGMIKLIYKNKGDRTLLKNWRAITLLNTDFKCMTGMISNRLKPMMDKLISADQACAVPNHFIEDQLIQLQDMYEYITQFGGKMMMCALDAKSAFDVLDHDYMIRVMKKMNIGSRIVRLTETIFRNMYSCVSINGARTKYFKLGRSCRQGDPNSMLQYVIAAEPFANLIRKTHQWSPVPIPNQPVKRLAQYADDITILSTQARDYERVIRLAEVFEGGAGSKLNAEKTEILLVGKWGNDEIRTLPKDNVKQNLKALGVWYGPDAARLNREQILSKMDDAMEHWKKFNLSFQGKKLIISVKLLSQCYHVIRITGMDSKLQSEIQKRINDFMWHPRKMKLVAYSTLQNTIDAGGLEMPNLDDIKRAILVERISKTLRDKRPWHGQLVFRMGHTLRDVIPDATSTVYSHTHKQTKTSMEIEKTYRLLRHVVNDWPSENFKSLKLKLHKNNEYKKRAQRDYTNTWREIHQATNDRKRRDLCYLIAHQSLTVKAVLAHRNIKLDDIKCNLCGTNDETIQHLFIECPMVQNLKTTIIRKGNFRTLTEEQILYHEGRSKMRKKQNEVIALYKHCIWITRAKLFYGTINRNQITDTLKYMYEGGR